MRVKGQDGPRGISSHGGTVCGLDDAGDTQFTAGCAAEGEGVECCRWAEFDVVGWYVCDPWMRLVCFHFTSVDD